MCKGVNGAGSKNGFMLLVVSVSCLRCQARRCSLKVQESKHSQTISFYKLHQQCDSWQGIVFIYGHKARACVCVRASQVPFGGSFYNLVQWCAWTVPGSDRVRLQVSCDVTFTKRWVPVKNIINSSSFEVHTMVHELDAGQILTAYAFKCLFSVCKPCLTYRLRL